MEELLQLQFEDLSSIKLKESGIRIIKNQTLLAPGFWNGREYTKEEIDKSYLNTNWTDKDVISLIADHNDDDSKGRPLTIRDWLGYVTNITLKDDGYLKGDLNLCNSALSTQLIDGQAPFGISPFIYGKYDVATNSQKDFTYKNFAVVVEPACKECYINEYLSDDNLNEKLENVSAFERIIKTLGKLDETTTSDVRGKKVDSNGLQKIKVKKKKKVSPGGHIPDTTGPHGVGAGPGEGKADGSGKLDLIDVKGGQKKMEENNEKIEKQPEEKEEEKVDEVSENVEKTENAENEEEEETEDKLVQQIASLTEKLMNKRKITPEQVKMQKLEKEIISLRKEMKKLQEEKSEEKEEEEAKKEDSEKLSAKPRTVARSIPADEKFSMFGKGASTGSQELAAIMGF